jgi:hypothetical protein
MKTKRAMPPTCHELLPGDSFTAAPRKEEDCARCDGTGILPTNPGAVAAITDCPAGVHYKDGKDRGDLREFRIMGRSAYGLEEIDRCNGSKEAARLVSEYRMAFGAGWSIWSEEVGA